MTFVAKDIIHGNIQPHNILISGGEIGEPRSYSAKITDLGHSAHFRDDDEYGFMPCFMPWQAPEWHHQKHTFSSMLKMEIYSFGLVCLWLLFNEQLCENDILFDFNAETQSCSLESKKRNSLQYLAEKLACNATNSLPHFTCFNSFFGQCLNFDQESRTSSISILLEILEASTPSTRIEHAKPMCTKPIASPPVPFSVSISQSRS